MRRGGPVILALLVAVTPTQSFAQGDTAPGDRIATEEEIASAIRPASLLPLRILSLPHRKLSAGMERGLIKFERKKVRERMQTWMENLRQRGVTPRFGGSGEGTGIGGGVQYRIPTGERHAVNLLGLLTTLRYQEFGINWSWDTAAGRLLAESSYQWRPEENFYGLGHASSKQNHTTFALRQSWVGFRYEITAARRFRVGALQRVAWISAAPGENALAPYATQARLQSTGIYLDLDGIRQEYRLGGALHVGASHQRSLNAGRFRYFAYEFQMEGRLPVVPDNSAVVAQANIELSRPRGGSGAIPFYLLPHIGGSSTLRGYALDRFYGMNLMLLSLEYRYRIHPNIQIIPFFDEGQIFDRTSDLSWLNWHRNYGIGLRLRSATGTVARIEYGRSEEGFQMHITFGDRERPPLRGPIRYGAYKR